MDKFPNWLLYLVFFARSIALADELDAVREAGDIYLKSYSREIQEDKTRMVDPENEVYISWLKELLFGSELDGQAVNLTYRTREVLVQILAVQIKQVSQPVKTSANILLDSRVLGDEEPGKSSMLDTLFPGYTLSGEVLKALMLAQPTSDIKELRRQQSLIRQTMQSGPLQHELPGILRQLKEYEPTVVSLFDRSDVSYSPEIQNLVQHFGNRSWLRQVYDQTVGGIQQGVRQLSYILYGLSMMAVATTPFLYPHCCSCKFLGSMAFSIFSLGVQAGVTGISYYADQVLEHNARTLYKLMRVRIDMLSHYLRQSLELQRRTDLPEAFRLTFTDQEMALIEAFLNGSQWLMTVDPKVRANNLVYASEVLWYSLELKQVIARMLYQGGRIDMYLAIARRMKSTESADNGQLTFARFRGETPLIVARGLWNPVLDPGSVVTNDISLVANDACPAGDRYGSFVNGTCIETSGPPLRNLLLSGCNASGKSTMMRAITVNSIFLAQIFGIATAESFETGLFHAVYSHMDKYDQTGQFSSYEAELDHAMQVLAEAKDLNSNQNMLACFDELFSNTDPEESLYVTNRVLSAMAQQLRTINIVSSHYDIDTSGIAAENKFARMHMHVEKVNRTLVKTYQLRQGQNRQTNGLFHLMEKFRLFPDIYSELELLIEKESHE